MRAPVAASLLIGLAGCATAGRGPAAPQGSLVVPERPAGHCTLLATLTVRRSAEVVMPEDALLASAVNDLERGATERGATHLVVARASQPAMVAWSTTARASGEAYRCDEPAR